MPPTKPLLGILSSHSQPPAALLPSADLYNRPPAPEQGSTGIHGLKMWLNDLLFSGALSHDYHA